MREYIEREALLRYLNDIWLTAKPTDLMPDDDRQLAIVRCMGLNDAMDAVKSLPAADVRPVVRGRWVGNKRHQSCSECHMTYCVPDGLDGELDMTAYHFYPNCGARMEES